MIGRQVEVDVSIPPDALLARLKQVFPERERSRFLSILEPVFVGIYRTERIMLYRSDSVGRRPVPRFEGRIEPSPRGARLTGTIGIDPRTLGRLTAIFLLTAVLCGFVTARVVGNGLAGAFAGPFVLVTSATGAWFHLRAAVSRIRDAITGALRGG